MWTNKEKAFLTRQAGILSTNEISKKLKKKPDCIRQMASTLGVSLFIEKLDAESKSLMLEMLKHKHPKQQISEVTGVSLSTVTQYAKNPNKCNRPKRRANPRSSRAMMFDSTTKNLVNTVFSL